MIESDKILERAGELKTAGTPFALVTVVRCESPTSAKPGAKAVVTADGRIEGWIGGGCTQPVVIKVVKQALEDGQPRLIRVSPERGAPAEEGIIDFGMTCHSGGTLDIFIDPVSARPGLVIIGASPAAQVLCALGRLVGFSIVAVFPGAGQDAFPEADRVFGSLDAVQLPAGVPAFVVVCTQGKFDEEGLEAALGTGAEYIAFVASERKVGKLKRYLKDRGHNPSRVDAIIAPAGVEIGARTPEEIALSVLAGVVQARRSGLGAVRSTTSPQTTDAGPQVARNQARAGHGQGDKMPAEAIDPVCGMTVETSGAAYRAEHGHQVYYFCCAQCRQRFEKEPDHYLEAAGS